jgi:hypothetical protein
MSEIEEKINELYERTECLINNIAQLASLISHITDKVIEVEKKVKDEDLNK